MTFNAQREAQVSIEKTGLGALAIHEFRPELLERDLVMMRVKANRFALSAMCVAFLAGIMIALEYSGAPSYIGLGFPQYLLLACYTSTPILGLVPYAFTCVFGLGFAGLLRSAVMKRQEIWNPSFGVHMWIDRDRPTATTLAEVFALMFFNPAVYALIIRTAMVSGIGVVFDLPSHREFNCIKFNEGLQAKRVNCWNPDRREDFTSRAISSQAAGTLAEGSSTT